MAQAQSSNCFHVVHSSIGTAYAFIFTFISVRLVKAPEGKPVDSFSIRGFGAIEVQSVQIGRMAVSVPPGSLVAFGAVEHVMTMIIVLVFRLKLHITEIK